MNNCRIIKMKFKNSNFLICLIILIICSTILLETFSSGKLTDEAIAKRFEDRHQHLYEKCFEYGLDMPYGDEYRPVMSHFIVNQEIGLVWCPVFKAASSTWLHYMNILAGYTEQYLASTSKSKWTLIREKIPRTTLKQLHKIQKNSVSMLVVRHPFERILSGYCDKLATFNPYYNELFGNKIISAYRQEGYVPENPEYPTFREFILWLNDLIKNGEHINEHFEMATKYCTPCLVGTAFILKVETLKEDQDYFLRKSGISEFVEPIWMNKYSCGGKDAKHFFSQLTHSDIKHLEEYYKPDLELFSYSAKEYYDMVN